MKEVLVIDDEQQMLMAIEATLKKNGYSITTAGSGTEALNRMKSHFYQAVISDVRMPELDGMHLLREMKRKWPSTPVIMLTGHGTVRDAVEALKQGAFDYLLKPFSARQLTEVLGKATEVVSGPECAGIEIVSEHPRMHQLLDMAAQAASGDATILIEAESGTGKELLARFIHQRSGRAGAPLVAVNCAALPDDLLESELFGHEKGSFTGALQKKLGKFELAQKGTLLLDEIGEMAPRLQAKLLRVLQEKEIDRVGGSSPIPMDVRIIATTNQNLKEMVRDGRFRQDLYYRLNVIPLSLPPLRQRKEDIPALVGHFCRKFENQRTPVAFSDETLALLKKYDWPGNIRELENVTRRALTLCRNPLVTPADLFLDVEEEGVESPQLKAGISLRELEKELIRITLQETGSNRTRAAELLGISLRTLRNKLSEYRKEGLVL